MKAYIGKYVMTALSAAVLAAGTLPVSAQYRVSPQTQQYADVQDAAVSDTLRGAAVDGDSVYTIERCYTLVEENYPLVRRYGLLDLTEEFTLKNAYMNYFPQISLQGSASWQTDVLQFPFDLSPYGIDMPTFSKDQYAAVIELSQVLWDGGMIAANRANIRAKADVDMAEQEINMYSLREKINDLYFGILYLDQQIRQVDIMMEEHRELHRQRCGQSLRPGPDRGRAHHPGAEPGEPGIHAGGLSEGSDPDDGSQDRRQPAAGDAGV